MGPDHIGALVATAIICALATILGRRLRGTPRALLAGRALALLLLAGQIADPFIAHGLGWLSWRNSLPLELCDAGGFAIMVALWQHRQLPFELAFFWGLGGTLQAILTPDLDSAVPFPHPEYLRFFGLHIGIVAGVFYLGPGLGMRPRPGAQWRVLGLTLLYAAGVGMVNYALGANYMYLCAKPTASPLDVFGPWPWYLVGATAIAATLFALLALPYRFSSVESS